MTIGDRIRLKREELNMSQDELAKRLGYKSRSSINKIEMDSRNLTQARIKDIADALETTPSYIMGWEEPTVVPSGADFDEWDKKFNPNDELAAEAAMWDFIGKRYGEDTAEMMNQILELKPKEQEKISKLLTGYSKLDDEDRIILFARAYQILEDMLADDKYSAKGGLKHA